MIDFLEKDPEKKKKDHSLWVERYRPSTLSEYIGNDLVKESCKVFVEKADIPQLLLFGPPGTGKTSLAKILTKQINCDVLYMNASDENRVDDVRVKIKNFAAGVGFKPLKVLILDEADRMTQEAQGIMRNLMETYSAHTRFILTCNYVEKMIDPITSRCQAFEIKPISKKEIAVKLSEILKTEKVEHTIEDIAFIVNLYYPDIRKVINFAQQSSLHGKIRICKENAIDVDFLNKLVSLLKTGGKLEPVFAELRQLVADFDTDSFELIYKQLFARVDEFAKGKEALIIYELAQGLVESNSVISKVRDITFLSCMYKILNHLK